MSTTPRGRWSRRWGQAGLILDLTMLGLAIANLSWIIFDSIWQIPELYAVMALVIPESWLAAYAPVHERFFRIDLIFVSIFLTEFGLRWAEALWRRRYDHPLMFPLLHWYDLLGCIPVAELRWLRVLRIWAVIVRLQKLEYIDYRTWWIYRMVRRVYDIVMEEISDRVVIQVLGGVQNELASSGPLEHQVMEHVIAPREELIVTALRERMVHVVQRSYRASREDMHAFITSSVSKAVHDNRQVSMIDRIPMVGGVASQLLDHAITDIVCRVIDELAGELDGANFEALFEDICHSVIESLMVTSAGDGDELKRAINDVIELVKQQVARRQWMENPQSQTADSLTPQSASAG